MRQRGFALFDVLLAVVLMAIAAAGSYTLVKSFRTNSSTQQLIRYSTTITQSFIPFLNSADITHVLKDNQLSSVFLKSIGIPDEDQQCSNGFCAVVVDLRSDILPDQSFLRDSHLLGNYRIFQL